MSALMLPWSVTADVGLNRAAFETCLDSGRYLARVHAESEDARQRGVDRTPTLEVNGKRLVGASPEGVRAVIERAKAGAGT